MDDVLSKLFRVEGTLDVLRSVRPEVQKMTSRSASADDFSHATVAKHVGSIKTYMIKSKPYTQPRMRR
ncbi:MAG: hypothetical protein BGO21_07685 [Dyadobacter sp. 50-39]|nr:MAG: hypothetical protein BGO21_07685 [Dyadobacter sp. 50-39]